MTDSKEVKAAKEILKEHKEIYFCCYADRGPCVLDGIPLEKRTFKCSDKTCSVCAKSPHLARKPVWPCAPVTLAEATLKRNLAK